MINFISICEVVNIFSFKKAASLRKLRMGANRYMGVNWSTTTNKTHYQLTTIVQWENYFKG